MQLPDEPVLAPVDILILGAGWTSTFLIPLCNARGLSHAATSRAGRPGTLPFAFDPDSDDAAPFAALPPARTVLISFPIRSAEGAERLVRLYERTHAGAPRPAFVQLGSTGIWDGSPTLDGVKTWTDRRSAFDETNTRAQAESALLALSPRSRTTVLNLAGLWGGPRQPKNWIGRVAPNKDTLKRKGSVHLIHGEDVSRAILAVHEHFDRADGQRWLLTDGRVYDWWNLAAAWGEAGQHPRWVRELMVEEGVRALPRSAESMGRAMDSREFWTTFDLEPAKGRLGEE